MKFILQEDKFILNEKFLLNERFILTEATAAEIAQKWHVQLTKTFGNTGAVLNKYIEYAGLPENKNKDKTRLDEWSKKFKEATEELEVALRQPLAEINGDLATTKTHLNSCLEVLKAISKSIEEADTKSPKPENKNTLNNLKKIVDPLTMRAAAMAWTASDVTKLKQILEGATELTANLLDNSVLEADLNSIQKFKEDCTKCLELLTEIKTKLPAEFDFTKLPDKELVTFQKTAKQLLDSALLKDAAAINKGLVVANFKTYWEQVKVLKNGYTTLTELPGLSHLAAEKERTKDGVDWKTKLASAVDKETVIEEFIYTTWPDLAKAQEVIKIKAALLQECEHYGFLTTGEKLNPFITFISTVYLKNDYGVKPELYNIIHNLVASNVLAGKDLAGKGEMGYGNLVFCKALYKLNAGAIKLYIRKQHNLLTAAKRPDTFESNAEMAFNILYKVATIVQGKDAKNATGMQLRSIDEIEQLEAKWIGEVSDTAEEPKNKVATNAELIKQIDTTEDAINVLVAMAIKFSTSDEITKAVKGCTEAKQRMSKSYTIAETQALVAKVERLYKLTAINASQALKLVKSILESDKFNLTKE
jgi:hypothetical protein